MGELITIVVRPVPRGRGAATALFDAFVDGKFLCRSRQPFLDGCRALLKRGADPETIAQMQHAGTATLSLRGPIGKAARLSVRDRPSESAPTFETYCELDRAAAARARSRDPFRKQPGALHGTSKEAGRRDYPEARRQRV